VNIGKWSDGVQRVVIRDGAREKSEEVEVLVLVENVIFILSWEVNMLS